MRIGELAKQAGVSVETIRYYEQQGLLEKSARSDSNYRRFGSDAEKRLRFIVQCRLLDMSMKDIQRLLSLVDTPEANCGDVDEMLDEHIAKVREQRRNLEKLEKSLLALRSDCHPSMQVKGCGILRDSALLKKDNAKMLGHG
jgi:Cd(II)/Pb(II)-responsive transcriptional regulator